MGMANPITGATTATCFHAGVLCNCMPGFVRPRLVFYNTYHAHAPRHLTRRERELADLKEQFRSEHRDLKRGRFAQKLEARIIEQQREKKAMLDAGSRARSAPTSTKRKDARRLQTYDAAMHERQMRR